MQEEDRRIRRTRRALADALMQLAAGRPYESITIRDITDQADVGYATFFRHYGSKDDLMLDIFQSVAHTLESMAGGHGGDFFEKEGLLIFTHVRDNAALYRSILDSLVFRRKLKILFAGHIGRRIAVHTTSPPAPGVFLEVVVNHMAVSLVGLIEWWLENDLQPPVEQTAQIYDRLIIRATWHAMLAEKPLPLQSEAHGHS